MKSPCYQCQDRESGCHARCEKYAESKKKRDAIKEDRAKRAKINGEIGSILFGGKRKR